VFDEPVPPQRYGAYHGAELWYAFDNLSLRSWPWEPADHRLADRMSEWLVSFARRARLSAWPDFGSSGLAMRLDSEPDIGEPFNRDCLEFFERLAAARASRD
jgi:para-nitrobenzyl esterase